MKDNGEDRIARWDSLLPAAGLAMVVHGFTQFAFWMTALFSLGGATAKASIINGVTMIMLTIQAAAGLTLTFVIHRSGKSWLRRTWAAVAVGAVILVGSIWCGVSYWYALAPQSLQPASFVVITNGVVTIAVLSLGVMSAWRCGAMVAFGVLVATLTVAVVGRGVLVPFLTCAANRWADGMLGMTLDTMLEIGRYAWLAEAILAMAAWTLCVAMWAASAPERDARRNVAPEVARV